MMKFCVECGEYQEHKEDKICQCGGIFDYSDDVDFNEFYSWERDEVMVEDEGDFYYRESNNIDNILEWKRSKNKLHIDK